MADVNEDVKAMVEAELKKNADIPNEELIEKAQKLDSSVATDRRSFNARYVLQAKRRLGITGGRKGGRGRKKTAGRSTGAKRPRTRTAARATAGGTADGAGRSAVRSVLVQFARDVASAEDKADVVAVIGDVDKYVDRVLKAAGAS